MTPSASVASRRAPPSKPLRARTLAFAAVFGVLASGCRQEPPAPPAPPVAGAPRASIGATGAVDGLARVTGEVPALPALRTSASVARQCGEEVPDRSVVVSPEGGLAYVVVSLGDGDRYQAPSPPPEPAVVDQRRCVYEPPVVAARAGGTLELLNSDPLIHNVRAVAKSTLFNLAMPLEGMKTRKPLPATPGRVTLHCDVHPWMRAVVRTFDHPFFAVTGPDGRFSLQGLPAGRHELVFWHDRLPERRVTVDIPAGGTARAQVAWEASELQSR